jgi:hypothetical protein
MAPAKSVNQDQLENAGQIAKAIDELWQAIHGLEVNVKVLMDRLEPM